MYTTCKRTDTERMTQIVEQTHGRRLLYKKPDLPALIG
jgi:hypothetical protein